MVTAGLSTGVCALLVPARLHAAGASSGQIGLAFAAAGILFAVGSALTAAAGRRAVNLPVTCAGMLVLAAALSLAVAGHDPAAARRDAVRDDRGPVRAVDGQLPAGRRGGRRRAGVGASVGLLNVIWAATAVLGPLGAGVAAAHLGTRRPSG